MKRLILREDESIFMEGSKLEVYKPSLSNAIGIYGDLAQSNRIQTT